MYVCTYVCVYVCMQDIWVNETIRKSHMYGAEKLKENQKELQREGRGYLDYAVDANSNIIVFR